MDENEVITVRFVSAKPKGSRTVSPPKTMTRKEADAHFDKLERDSPTWQHAYYIVDEDTTGFDLLMWG